MIDSREKYYKSMVASEELPLLEYIPTIPQFLNHICEKFDSHTAISDNTQAITYKDMVSRIAKRVHYINSMDLKKEAHIAVYSGNTIDAMELFLAIPAAGCVVMMIPEAVPVSSLTTIVNKFDIDTIFACDEVVDDIRNMGILACNISSLSEEEANWAIVKKDTPAAIFMTSGTTDIPKGVVLSHGAILRGAYNGCFCPGHVLYQRYMAVLPLSHVFGSLRGFLTCLYTGSHVLACLDVKEAITSIPVWKPTALVLVPGMVELIMNLASIKGKDFLGDLRLIISGAAPLSPSLIDMCNRFGISICHGYGLTECANLTSGNNNINQMPNSVGPVYPEQEVKLVNKELWLKGDNVMLGYYNEPQLNAAVFEDGWFKTGDLAKFEEYEGTPFLVITGRIKNVIILANGENVSPEELEDMFYKYPAVKECLVQEMNVNTTSVLGIEIYPNIQGSDTELKEVLDKIIEEINQQLPSFKRIAKLVIRKEPFKKSPAMKIIRN